MSEANPYTQEEINEAERIESQVFEAQQKQILMQRVVTLRAAHKRLEEENTMLKMALAAASQQSQPEDDTAETPVTDPGDESPEYVDPDGHDG